MDKIPRDYMQANRRRYRAKSKELNRPCTIALRLTIGEFEKFEALCDAQNLSFGSAAYSLFKVGFESQAAKNLAA